MGKWSKLLICRCFKVRRPHSIGASCLSEGDLDRVLRSTDHTIMPASGEMERELKNVLSRVRSRKSGSAESVNIFSRIFEEKLNLLVRWIPGGILISRNPSSATCTLSIWSRFLLAI